MYVQSWVTIITSGTDGSFPFSVKIIHWKLDVSDHLPAEISLFKRWQQLRGALFRNKRFLFNKMTLVIKFKGCYIFLEIWIVNQTAILNFFPFYLSTQHRYRHSLEKKIKYVMKLVIRLKHFAGSFHQA